MIPDWLALLVWCSHELVDALSLYHTLMRDMPPAYSAYSAYMPPPSSLAGQAPMAGMPPYMGGPAAMMMPPMSNGPMGGGGPTPYPMYYMDPSLYPGTAPPPTPPLQEGGAMNSTHQQQQADYMGQQQQQQQQMPLYSQHTPWKSICGKWLGRTTLNYLTKFSVYCEDVAG
jgi:hypothetical protein